MNERLIEEVMERVRQTSQRPAALLLGQAPARDYGWQYVSGGSYSAVVIGSMTAGELLRFPDEKSAEALLEGKPVYVCREGLTYRRCAGTANRVFWSRLLAAERQMKQLGVEFLGGGQEKLLTAEEVRRRLREGLAIEGRLTPLARDVLEGKL